MTRGATALAAALLAIGVVAASFAAPGAAADGDAEFAESATTVPSGETANVTVLAPAGDDSARPVTVGSNETNFVVRASVADGNGDGRVSLLIDTAEAGTGDASSYLSVSEGDELRSAEQVTSELSDPIDPAAYDLAVGPADDPRDVATLVVEAPSDRSERTPAAETPSLPVADADADAITVLPSEDRLAVDPESERTIRGETTFEAGTNLTVRVKAESGRRYLQSTLASVNDSGGFAATFDFGVADPGSTFELVVIGPGETREVVPGRVSGTWIPPEDDSGAEPGGGDDGSGGSDPAASDYPLPDADAGSDAITVLPSEKNLSLEAAAGRVVRGETSLEPGTALDVRLRAVRGRQFIKSAEAEVGEFGTFSARFDLDEIPAGTTFVLRVEGPDGTVEEVPGRVVACDSDCGVPEATSFPVDGFGVVAVTEVTRGDEGRIPIRLDDREEATLVIGDDSVNYRVGTTVRDGDGDGRILAAFDSAAAGDDAPTLRVVSRGDSGESAVEETDLPRLVAAGSYPVALYPGANTTGDPIDTGELVIGQPSDGVGTDATRTTAAPTPALDSDPGGSPVGEALDSRLLSVGGIAVGGVLALAGVAIILGRH